MEMSVLTWQKEAEGYGGVLNCLYDTENMASLDVICSLIQSGSVSKNISVQPANQQDVRQSGTSPNVERRGSSLFTYI